MCWDDGGVAAARSVLLPPLREIAPRVFGAPLRRNTQTLELPLDARDGGNLGEMCRFAMYGHGDAAAPTVEVFSTGQIRDHLVEIVERVEAAIGATEIWAYNLAAWTRPPRSALALVCWLACCRNACRIPACVMLFWALGLRDTMAAHLDAGKGTAAPQLTYPSPRESSFDESRRRRGCETSRGEPAAATLDRDESRRIRGRDADLSEARGDAAAATRIYRRRRESRRTRGRDDADLSEEDASSAGTAAGSARVSGERRR